MNIKIIIALIIVLMMSFASSIFMLSSEIEQANNKQSSEKEIIDFKERCNSMYGNGNWTEHKANKSYLNPRFIPIYYNNNTPITCVQMDIP